MSNLERNLKRLHVLSTKPGMMTEAEKKLYDHLLTLVGDGIPDGWCPRPQEGVE